MPAMRVSMSVSPLFAAPAGAMPASTNPAAAALVVAASRLDPGLLTDTPVARAPRPDGSDGAGPPVAASSPRPRQAKQARSDCPRCQEFPCDPTDPENDFQSFECGWVLVHWGSRDVARGRIEEERYGGNHADHVRCRR